MITVRSPLPSYVEIARRQMERYLERMTAIEAKVEREKKRRLDEWRARQAAEAVDRVAERARRQAELEAEAAKAARAAQADAEIRSTGIIPIGAILGACAVFLRRPDLQPLRRSAHTGDRQGPSHRHVPRQGTDAAELARYRTPDWRKRSYDRPPRRAQDRRAHQAGSQPRRRGGDHPRQDCG